MKNIFCRAWKAYYLQWLILHSEIADLGVVSLWICLFSEHDCQARLIVNIFSLPFSHHSLVLIHSFYLVFVNEKTVVDRQAPLVVLVEEMNTLNKQFKTFFPFRNGSDHDKPL